MTNREIIANYNGLDYIQSLEAEHYKRTGEKLFQGRVKITYAIKKNMRELLDKLNLMMSPETRFLRNIGTWMPRRKQKKN